MNEKQAITQKIIEDANALANAIIQKALEDADNARAECRKACDNNLSEAKEVALKKGEKIVERQKTLARLDAKKVILEGKQSLILRASDNAKKRLNEMNEEQYLAFVEKQLQNYAEKEDKVVICASAPISEQQVSNLAIAGELVLSVERGENFGGGIKLFGKTSDKDLSFGAIVDRFLTANVQEVSAIIFK